jgi:hypothetical protein
MAETKDNSPPGPPPNIAATAGGASQAPAKPLGPAAQRALAEAAARRAERARSESQAPQEIGGRGGLDPTRYGDWEVKGTASDF